MKVNLLYVLSKISIIAIFAYNFFIGILNLSFIQSAVFSSLTHLLISVVGIIKNTETDINGYLSHGKLIFSKAFQ